jgi:Ca-activated chloride channel family protein
LRWAAGLAGRWTCRRRRSFREEIAQITGGKAFFPKSGAELEEITTRIALELRHQHSIGHSPTDVNNDGRWRKVKVSVKPPKRWSNLKAQHKEGLLRVRHWRH